MYVPDPVVPQSLEEPLGEHGLLVYRLGAAPSCAGCSSLLLPVDAMSSPLCQTRGARTPEP
eukprot:6642166-Pyramimonas_sp.AAC.1